MCMEKQCAKSGDESPGQGTSMHQRQTWSSGQMTYHSPGASPRSLAASRHASTTLSMLATTPGESSLRLPLFRTHAYLRMVTRGGERPLGGVRRVRFKGDSARQTWASVERVSTCVAYSLLMLIIAEERGRESSFLQNQRHVSERP